jgi:ankyrin repeat protein
MFTHVISQQYGETALMISAWQGRLDLVTALCTEGKVNVNLRNDVSLRLRESMMALGF